MSDAPLSMPRQPKRSRKKLIIFIIIAVVIVISVVAAVASKKREKPIEVTTEKAVRRSITQLVTATGKIQPEVLVKISPEVSGEIIELPVKEGQIVQKGQLLLRIKPDTYRAQVEESEAALSGARSASTERRTQLEKSRLDYERAGTDVMSIADLSSMEAQVNVNENDVINVKVGDHAFISVDAYPGRKIDGVVREIASTATTNNAGTQEEVTNFLVKIRVDDHTVRLRPGMSTTADIETETVADTITVPIQSVTVRSTDSKLSPEELERATSERAAKDKDDNKSNVSNETQEKQKARAERERLLHVVFVRNGDKVSQRKVETGIADNTYIEIKAGLKPGEEVVSGSYTAVSRKLKDGSKVAIEKVKT